MEKEKTVDVLFAIHKQLIRIADNLDKNKERKPYCCPVCAGVGLIWVNVVNFPYQPDITIINNPTQKVCTACNGKGIIWNQKD
jgi:hypothetical protein